MYDLLLGQDFVALDQKKLVEKMQTV